VASKSFLITIGDRSITGMVARDQMVGPWQVPVADVAVTTAAFDTLHGEAMSMGERTPIALLDAASSGRMAIGEAITNIAAASIDALSDIKLSANWMVAAGHPGEGAKLYDTVHAIAKDLCPKLGIAIPVGKDSMSMRAKWNHEGKEEQVTSPLSLVVTAFAPVRNARKTLTPQLRTDLGDTELWLIDLGRGQNRIGASALGYVFDQLGQTAPTLDNATDLVHFFDGIQAMNREGLLLAYHDRSDGGLWSTLCEMGFAGRTGLNIDIHALGSDPIRALFAEELGAVVQVRTADRARFTAALKAHHLSDLSHCIGHPSNDERVQVSQGDTLLLAQPLLDLYAHWIETSHHIQSVRDNPACADEERASNLNAANTGLTAQLTYNPNETLTSFTDRPRMAILREQGVNGQVEMAAAFDRAGFEAIDVHMSDLRSGRVSLTDFTGLVACGGFSYGDVLGAGGGWAKSILFSETLRAEFKAFFHRPDTFALGVCNGCQMLSQLKDLIPGADHWPEFVRNTSVQFEARLSQVEVLDSPSIFFKDMTGSTMPIPVAHGEGHTRFDNTSQRAAAKAFAALRYIDSDGNATEHYPENPNGSADGFTAFTTTDGRATVMMPHPERAFRTVQFSWHPDNWDEDGPWMRLFRNARQWVGSTL
jgi:phosphoribosylformylglycinamidine synthase